MVGLEAEIIDIGLREGRERNGARGVFVRDVANLLLELFDFVGFVLKYMLVSDKLLTREPGRGFLAPFTGCGL